MAVQDIYANITNELMTLPGQPSSPPRFGMTAQPTAMIQPQPTSQGLGLGTGQEGALTSRFASRQGGLGSIEPRPIDSQVAASGHDPVTKRGAPKEKSSFGFWTAVKHIVKGVISPIKQMFSSPGNFLKGAAVIGAGLLIASTGPFGLAAVALIGGGLGAFQLGKGIYQATEAETDEELGTAFENIGAGAVGLGTAALSVGGLRNLGRIASSPRVLGRGLYQSVRSGDAGRSMRGVYHHYRGTLGVTTPRIIVVTAQALPLQIPNLMCINENLLG